MKPSELSYRLRGALNEPIDLEALEADLFTKASYEFSCGSAGRISDVTRVGQIAHFRKKDSAQKGSCAFVEISQADPDGVPRITARLLHPDAEGLIGFMDHYIPVPVRKPAQE